MEEIFFIAGVMRSGTTYLATILDEHPEICMAKPLLPEPKFFLKQEEYTKGLDYYRSRYFTDCSTERVLGEKTVHYCEREDALIRISNYFPHCKILLMIRNPTTRALSNYFFSLKNRMETRTIEDVFLYNKPEPVCREHMYISPFDYLERGKYIEKIGLVGKYFSRENIKIIIMEDFIGSKNLISELYEYLNVNPDFIPPSINSKIHANEKNIFKVNKEIIVKLNEYYHNDNIQLEDYLNINLNSWTNDFTQA
jgi:hypothetical protein